MRLFVQFLRQKLIQLPDRTRNTCRTQYSTWWAERVSHTISLKTILNYDYDFRPIDLAMYTNELTMPLQGGQPTRISKRVPNRVATAKGCGEVVVSCLLPSTAVLRVYDWVLLWVDLRSSHWIGVLEIPEPELLLGASLVCRWVCVLTRTVNWAFVYESNQGNSEVKYPAVRTDALQI
jgi:hypothetical protein